MRNSGKKAKIAITFDDGPHPKYTQKFVELLLDYQVPATFFFTGSAAEKYPDIVKFVFDNSFEIGNHGYSHKTLRWRKSSFLKKEIVKTDEILSAICELDIPLFRPPYLRYGFGLLYQLKKFKKKLVLATVSTKDFKCKSADEIVRIVQKKAKKDSILVFHDGGNNQEMTLQALEILIPKYKEKGFLFVPVSHIVKQR
jgi:peptidoglycan-N-acetylglucosamine deacetylase